LASMMTIRGLTLGMALEKRVDVWGRALEKMLGRALEKCGDCTVAQFLPLLCPVPVCWSCNALCQALFLSAYSGVVARRCSAVLEDDCSELGLKCITTD
jgi:hypothetical protein